MLYNVQDLFLDLAYDVSPGHLEALSENQWQHLGRAGVHLKPLQKLRGLAAVMLQEQPDVIALCEVGGKAALENFSRLFLEDAYAAWLVEGNDRRGIHNGFLVRRSLPLSVRLIGNRNWKVPFTYLHEDDPEGYGATAEIASCLDLGKPEERLFSRDLPELRLVDGSGNVRLAILLAHLKSGFDPYRIDPRGQVRRRAEVKALVELHARLQAELGPQVPVVVAGDFNGNASREATASEFELLYSETDLEDSLWLAGYERYERITHVTYFRDGGSATQLDYVFLPPLLQGGVSRSTTYVYRYRFDDQTPMELPFSMADRRSLPSDHYPVVCWLDI